MLFRKPKPVLVISAAGALSDKAQLVIESALLKHSVNSDYHVLVLPVGLTAEILTPGTRAAKRETR